MLKGCKIKRKGTQKKLNPYSKRVHMHTKKREKYSQWANPAKDQMQEMKREMICKGNVYYLQ